MHTDRASLWLLWLDVDHFYPWKYRKISHLNQLQTDKITAMKQITIKPSVFYAMHCTRTWRSNRNIVMPCSLPQTLACPHYTQLTLIRRLFNNVDLDMDAPDVVNRISDPHLGTASWWQRHLRLTATEWLMKKLLLPYEFRQLSTESVETSLHNMFYKQSRSSS